MGVLNIPIPASLAVFCSDVRKMGGRALLVGGCVRDAIMGYQPKDVDVEVYGLSLENVQGLLCGRADAGHYDAVGASFGVLKARFYGQEVDISLPRLDSKSGAGHKGFVVEMKSDLTVEQAAARRDFTINAMAYNPLNGEVIDPYGGRSDIECHKLHPTSKAFAEDPLRVLRGMQFAARFGMFPSMELIRAANSIIDQYHTLAPERVWGEWEKWATKGRYPSLGLQFLRNTDWMGAHYLEIARLRYCEQDPIWHPEGNAYVHTLHVCDAMARLCEADGIKGENRCVLMFAALCHDFGKASCTSLIDGRWRSPGHASASVPLAENFLKRIGCFQRIIDRVLPLVEEHMAHVGLDVNKRTVRRLANRVAPATIRELAYVVHADMAGRPPLPAEQNEKMLEILQYAESENVAEEKVQPLVMGRDLLSIGYVAGPEMGRVLKYLYEKQLDGEFSTKEEGIAFLNQMIED